MKENLECPDISTLTPSRDMLRKCNFSLLAENRTRDAENVVRCSANWATEAVAESMPTSSVFMMWECRLSEEYFQHFHSTAYCKWTILMDENLECPGTSTVRPDWDLKGQKLHFHNFWVLRFSVNSSFTFSTYTASLSLLRLRLFHFADQISCLLSITVIHLCLPSWNRQSSAPIIYYHVTQTRLIRTPR